MRLWNKIKEDLIRWNAFNLSFLGRVAVIKMVVLPKMLYLFQTIHVLKKKEQFRIWHKGIPTIIWAGKNLRIKLKMLCNAKERGRLQLPNLELYHEAACLAWMRDWITLQNIKLLALEAFNKIYKWHAYLMYGKVRADLTFNHHYIRSNLLKVWLKI